MRARHLILPTFAFYVFDSSYFPLDDVFVFHLLFGKVHFHPSYNLSNAHGLSHRTCHTFFHIGQCFYICGKLGEAFFYII
jgi:hypothetical protein